MAIDILFELIEKGNYELVWSFILEHENSMNPFIQRKLHIQSISTLCKEIIKPNNEIKIIAKNIVKNSNTKDKDALHLASAIYNNCDYFITCDDKFIKTIEKGSLVLIKELGYSGLLGFIRYSEGISNEDYLKLDEEIFKDMSVDKIFDDAKEY